MKFSIRCGLASMLVAVMACGVSPAARAETVVAAANGQVIGPLMAEFSDKQWLAYLGTGTAPLRQEERLFAGSFELADEVGAGFVEIWLDQDGIRHPYSPFVYFTEPGCQGTSFISAAASRASTQLPAAVVGREAVLFLSQSSQSDHAQVYSRLDQGGCTPFAHVVRAYRAANQGSLLQRFPAPYFVH
ncbi:hypothetical protein [Tahibacter amnicola]|uniref:Uncharacterized protein n=1 Tax=Tahibacter amnicola TaxID=2976241 RepID=A0ABY6BGY2_9GAMM|nr:hypothetical protein [Tahibacter amnicola]UXI69278.1 hypothetical protein N4264_06415 [Tahibacter amnicola]